MQRCTKYGLEVQDQSGQTPPKVIEKDQEKILWDFQIKTDKILVANQLDIVVVDKQEKKAVVVGVAISSDSNIRKEEHEKLKKYQDLKQEL